MIWRVVGVVALVAGLVLTFVAGWEFTAVANSQQAQQDATDALVAEWDTPHPTEPGDAAIGAPVARLSIPRLGKEWTVVEGVGLPQLATGPGHYPGTAEPGEVGNFAVAGHRTGSMDVFRDLDQLEPCDEIVVRSVTGTFTYRVLPFDGRGDCAATGVDVSGREVVSPDRGDLVLPVPGAPKAAPRARLLTLTTCHPLGSNSKRLVLHAALD